MRGAPKPSLMGLLPLAIAGLFRRKQGFTLNELPLSSQIPHGNRRNKVKSNCRRTKGAFGGRIANRSRLKAHAMHVYLCNLAAKRRQEERAEQGFIRTPLNHPVI